MRNCHKYCLVYFLNLVKRQIRDLQKAEIVICIIFK